MRIPFAAAGGWRDDIYNHRHTIALWLLLNLLDYGLTVVALPLGAHELNPLVIGLSPPAFALYMLGLTTVAVAWLALCRWLWCLKWLNLGFIVLVGTNIYDLINLL